MRAGSTRLDVAIFVFLVTPDDVFVIFGINRGRGVRAAAMCAISTSGGMVSAVPLRINAVTGHPAWEWLW